MLPTVKLTAFRHPTKAVHTLSRNEVTGVLLGKPGNKLFCHHLNILMSGLVS